MKNVRDISHKMTWAERQKMQLPKSLQRYASRIADYSDERGSGSGIHVSYAYGWCSSTDAMGCVHGDVSDSVADALSHTRNAVRCDCKECVDGSSRL